MQRLASGGSTSVALLWDVAELLRLGAEPQDAATKAAAAGAVVVAGPPPSGDVAGTADAGTDVVVDVEAEASDAAAAAGAGDAQAGVEAQPAVLSRLAQVGNREEKLWSITSGQAGEHCMLGPVHRRHLGGGSQ